jgi:tetratricopeptide (TPR) repeat protein
MAASNISTSDHENDNSSDSYPFNLGTYTPSLLLPTSSPPAAQNSFTAALLWSYAFNHSESQACYRTALDHDPACAIAYWGLAVTGGPNYNLPWEAVGDESERREEVNKVREWLGKAVDLLRSAKSDEVVRRLVGAVGRRFGVSIEGEKVEILNIKDGEEEEYDFAAWNIAYAEAMEDVYNDFGHDPDIATLYIDALMNLHPWSLWDISTGQPAPGARTLKIKGLLEKSLNTPAGENHPGLIHLYIHLMEMSPRPEDALPIANRLRNLVPDAGHLLHMPTHLDVLCGDWEAAMEGNRLAIIADEKYLSNRGGKNFYTLYRCHDFHFRVYAAMFAGKYAVALETVEGLEKTLLGNDGGENVLQPMADFLEAFLGMRVHVYVRFGKWQELKEMKMPEDEELYCVTTAMIRYGKGVAAAVEGDQQEAQQQRSQFREARGKVKESRTLFNNSAKDILSVAAAMLDGEVEYRGGNVEVGFGHLRDAVDLSDKLPYDEPWGWMQPPRHALGALLLEQGRVEEAKVEYEKDLGLDESVPRQLRHPNNVWALHGYAECLRRLKGNQQELDSVSNELEALVGRADMKIGSSCFCRKAEKSV